MAFNGRPHNKNLVHILDADPALARLLPEASLAEARKHAVTQAVRLPRGPWKPPDAAEGVLALLIVDGLLSRHINLGRAGCTELLGTGDVLRPWDEKDLILGASATWQVVDPVTLAILDLRFGRVAAHWPELLDAILCRAIRRGRDLGLRFAVSHHTKVADRLTGLFWLLADRWGRPAPGGMLLPLSLTHESLARMIGARRPSVSAALGELGRAGSIRRQPGGGWWLEGDQSPVELAAASPGDVAEAL